MRVMALFQDPWKLLTNFVSFRNIGIFFSRPVGFTISGTNRFKWPRHYRSYYDIRWHDRRSTTTFSKSFP